MGDEDEDYLTDSSVSSASSSSSRSTASVDDSIDEAEPLTDTEEALSEEASTEASSPHKENEAEEKPQKEFDNAWVQALYELLMVMVENSKKILDMLFQLLLNLFSKDNKPTPSPEKGAALTEENVEAHNAEQDALDDDDEYGVSSWLDNVEAPTSEGSGALAPDATWEPSPVEAWEHGVQPGFDDPAPPVTWDELEAPAGPPSEPRTNMMQVLGSRSADENSEADLDFGAEDRGFSVNSTP
jgi:hypothetical protein